MANWQSLTKDEKLVILTTITENTGLVEQVVEKDHYVVQILKALFECSCNEHLVFKGGTSLSKGWNVIQRFSEDCDIAIDRKFFGFEGDLTNRQLKTLRSKSFHYIEDTLLSELKNKLDEQGIDYTSIDIEKGDYNDPTIINVSYDSVLDTPLESLKPTVRIEISYRSLKEPFIELPLNSIISENYPDDFRDDRDILINTVLRERTFLEKIFLIHEELQKSNPVAERKSRHLYDIEKLMHYPECMAAIKDKEFYNSIIHHRKTFNKISGIDYNTHQPKTINFIPSGESLKEWEDDYTMMQRDFIYGDSLPFKELIEKLQELNDSFKFLQ